MPDAGSIGGVEDIEDRALGDRSPGALGNRIGKDRFQADQIGELHPNVREVRTGDFPDILTLCVRGRT